MAALGTLGMLQSEGHGCADLEQNGFQHSMWSSAGNQTHSFLSTETKPQAQNYFCEKFCDVSAELHYSSDPCSGKSLSLEVCPLGLEHQHSIVTCARSPRTLCALLSEVPESFPLSSDTCTDMHTKAVQMCEAIKAPIRCARGLKHWLITSLKSRKAFWLLQWGQPARKFPGNQQRNPVVRAAVL